LLSLWTETLCLLDVSNSELENNLHVGTSAIASLTRKGFCMETEMALVGQTMLIGQQSCASSAAFS
jgi:hypothetical protein